MFESSFKVILKSAMVLFLGVFSSSILFADTDFITGNNSFGKAHSIGYWEYHGSTICKLEEGKDEAFFSFVVHSGDRVYVQSSYDQKNQGMGIYLYDDDGVEVDHGFRVVNPTSIIPFIFANVDATSTTQRFYIKVRRGNNTGDMIFAVHINNRIGHLGGEYDFIGKASNPGNPDILKNPEGVDSTIISMDLTNNPNIPKDAIVESITTEGDLHGNVRTGPHKIFSEEKGLWYTAIVNGIFGISTTDQLKVAQRWFFKYNVKARNSSTMDRVNALIEYEYDITDQFEYE